MFGSIWTGAEENMMMCAVLGVPRSFASIANRGTPGCFDGLSPGCFDGSSRGCFDGLSPGCFDGLPFFASMAPGRVRRATVTWRIKRPWLA